MDLEVPPSLRRWFVVHAVVDAAVGLPLVVAPHAFLGALGWTAVDPATPRLVGAALLAIGGQSFLARNAGIDVYRSLLGLKSLFSAAAIVATFLAIGDGAPPATWAALSTFLVFAGVWNYYRVRLRQLAAMAARPATDEPAPDGEDDEATDAAPSGETSPEAPVN